jgi:hypothetical protein
LRVELVPRRVGLDLEDEADLREPDRRILGNAERAAEIEIALRRYRSGFQGNVERRRHRLEGDAGAGDQRLEQHVAGAQLETGAAGRGMKAGNGERPAGLDLAGDVRVIEGAACTKRHHRRLRIGLVALLERRLHGAKRSGVHDCGRLYCGTR